MTEKKRILFIVSSGVLFLIEAMSAMLSSSYDGSDTTAQIVNDGRIQVGSPVTDAENETCTYLLAYVGSDDGMEALPSFENNVTPPLFDGIRFCNAREDRAETAQTAEVRSMDIRVNGCGIQTEYLGTGQGTETDPETVWAALQSDRSRS